MALNLVKRMKAIFGQTPPQDGVPRAASLMNTLDKNRHNLMRLAEQIQAHAEQAPYPHVARCLEHLVLEKRNSVKLLSKEILNLQGDPSIHQLDLQSGKNHWERINRDIEDQKVLVGNLLESSAHWAEKAPQIAELLKRITTVENSHKETLIQLLMRADPQAEQN